MGIICHMLHVTCYMSHAACHMLHVTCHMQGMSHATPPPIIILILMLRCALPIPLCSLSIPLCSLSIPLCSLSILRGPLSIRSIVGFTSMCDITPAQDVMCFLNDLYVRFDDLLDIYGEWGGTHTVGALGSHASAWGLVG